VNLKSQTEQHKLKLRQPKKATCECFKIPVRAMKANALLLGMTENQNLPIHDNQTMMGIEA
jgi:hypothetical protein